MFAGRSRSRAVVAAVSLAVFATASASACSSSGTSSPNAATASTEGRHTEPPSKNDPTTTSGGAQFLRPACVISRPAAPKAVISPDGIHEYNVTSFDGTIIRAHWFPKADTTKSWQQPRLPTILKGPGWGTAGDVNDTGRGDGLFGDINIANLHDAGYNVLTWDPRGFGKSSGTIEINNADFEGRDAQVLLDFVAAQPGVQLDAPSDPRVGMVGGSYGGGIQLVTAAIDCRVDAIVPTIAWHSLETSLYKNATFKSGWGNFLYDFAKDKKLDEHIVSSHDEGNSSGVLSAANLAWYRDRGPGDLVKKINVPTLFIQGTVDTLFTLDEAVTNYEILKAKGVPTAMTWYCGGHGVCLTKAGDQSFNSRLATHWLARYVKSDTSVSLDEEFTAVDQNGRLYSANKFPVTAGAPVSAKGSGSLRLAETSYEPNTPAPGAPTAILGGIAGNITPSNAKDAVNIDISFGVEALVLGAPTLTLTYTGTSPAGATPTRVFAQIVDPATNLVLGNLATPIKVELDGKEHTISLALEMVVFAAKRGVKLKLQLVATTHSYAAPRLGGTVAFSAIDVELPTVTGMRSL